ncbi:MAG: TrpB-like pyridoxal phosphate-dependent enzyme [Elusimicrobia bacterium]|nr:TrpB-like pyridoxal phosphate-dependent enzyme [Elusimicrobiota bacterium]
MAQTLAPIKSPAKGGVRVPTAWRNFLADMRRAGLDLPVPSKKTARGMRPVSLKELARVTSTEAARIERLEGRYGTDPVIEIPETVLSFYRTYRPTPFFRAEGFERLVARGLGKKRLEHAQLWIKDESKNPGGSHKMNTSIAQAYYLKQDGKTGVVTDTGAGQWGVSVAIAAEALGLEATVFMTAQSYRDKAGRVELMRGRGARVHSSPSRLTPVGRRELARDPAHPGSLGIGMSEAFGLVGGGTGLALGCMSYYAALHQSVIGEEVVRQAASLGVAPDALVACVGGGSNFCGLVAPFVADKLAGRGPDFVAAESANIPVLTKGDYRWDPQDFGGLMPRLLMKTLGHESLPPKHHAGGLRYHGKNPALSLMHERGLVDAVAVEQDEALRAGLRYQGAEGFLPAPESAHALAAAAERAARHETRKERRTIVALLTGDGALDSVAYASLR